MATLKQIEANRNNAKRSTGPKTDHGKEQSRLNAIKHGCRAEQLVMMPGESLDVYERRVDACIDKYRPVDDVETQLVRHIADVSWMLDRAKRQEGKHLIRLIGDIVKNTESDRKARFEHAWRLLLPSAFEAANHRPDPVDAIDLRTELEATAEGCKRLLWAWHSLRDSARAENAWNDLQELHVIRLLGHGPGVSSDPYLLEVIVASHVAKNHGFPLDARPWTSGPYRTIFDWAAGPEVLARRPGTQSEAFARLVETADREIARLDEVLAVRLRDGDLGIMDREELVERAMMDACTSRDQFRRYRSTLSAEMFRTIDALTKMRREEERRKKAEELAAPNEANSASEECEPPDFEPKEDRVLTPSARREVAPLPNEAKLSEAVVTNEPVFRNRWERRRHQALLRQAESRRSGG